ncbi:MAG: hypothetical protein KatS3mg129_1281 [Leptospiraceae bacterium]|nr:MAG: hypothetical protein KatS3mg129_1281 [Leptospiraceae bacterium]
MSESFLKDILIALSKNNVKYIIFGGVAVVLHGVERMTLDLDVSIEMSKENIDKFLKVMKEFNLSPRPPVPEDILYDKDLINYLINEKNAVAFTFIDKDKPFKQVDVLIHPDLKYEKWINKTQKIDLYGHEICILTKEAIIELKQNLKKPRDKDLIDIKELKKR